HRKTVLAISVVPVMLGFAAGSTLKMSFFPKDRSYLSYIDVWLPEDAPLSATRQAALEATGVIEKVAEEFAKEKAAKHKKEPESVLDSVTSFIGGSGPRFWFSVI